MNPVTKWACTSVVGCTASFILTVMPYLQFVAVMLSIIAGVRALLHSRAADRHRYPWKRR